MDTSIVEEHLPVCPLCREHADGLRALKLHFREMARPVMPTAIGNQVRRAVQHEVLSPSSFPVSRSTVDWIQMKLMPLSVGVLASLVIGFSILTLLLSGGLAINSYTAKTGASGSSTLIATSGSDNLASNSKDISPVEYARNRMAVSEASPSINPRGALASLSNTLSRHGIRNNEIVVVADVFSNGLARIAQVVEPSENDLAVDELQRALDSDLANAPFVPASMDSRSNNVRVVLKFQSVEVNSRRAPKRR